MYALFPNVPKRWMYSSIISSQSMLRFQNSYINNFGSWMAGEIIPKESNMLLVKLSIPRFVFGTLCIKLLLLEHLHLGHSELLNLFQKVFYQGWPTNFGDKMLFGTDFKMLWLFHKNFVRLRPRDDNNSRILYAISISYCSETNESRQSPTQKYSKIASLTLYGYLQPFYNTICLRAH